MIKVEELNFEYDGTGVLHGVNLYVKPGSITALVGPNGAGKTTLMLCIAGLETAVSGSILVNGQMVFSMEKVPSDHQQASKEKVYGKKVNV